MTNNVTPGIIFDILALKDISIAEIMLGKISTALNVPKNIFRLEDKRETDNIWQAMEELRLHKTVTFCGDYTVSWNNGFKACFDISDNNTTEKTYYAKVLEVVIGSLYNDYVTLHSVLNSVVEPLMINLPKVTIENHGGMGTPMLDIVHPRDPGYHEANGKVTNWTF